MVDTVTSDYIFKGTRKASIKLTNVSDGTGESSVVKIDVSTLVGPDGTAPTYVAVDTIEAMVQGFTSVRLYFDATTDDTLAILGAGYTYFDWKGDGGFVDPKSTGYTGDVLLTTAGGGSGSTYDITITFRLKD